MAAVNYFSQSLPFKIPFPRKTAAWLQRCAAREKFKIEALNFIFCSDQELHEINVQYLHHDTFTDIITFDNSEFSKDIEGDIFISIERVKENAVNLGISFQDELHRVMIHGVLHLMAYEDKSSAQKKEMRKKEDAYLSLR